MLSNVPEPDELAAICDWAAAEGRRRNEHAFDNHLSRIKAEGGWLPDNVEEIRRQFFDREIVLVRAVWLLQPPAGRQDYMSFEEELIDHFLDLALNDQSQTNADRSAE